MTEQTTFDRARWLRDLARFLPLKSQFVLSGNVRDLQIVETAPSIFAAVRPLCTITPTRGIDKGMLNLLRERPVGRV